MPIFEFKCGRCGTTFELLVRTGEKPSCPKCKSKRLKKLVSGFAAPSSKGTRECGCNGHCCCDAHCACGH